MYKNPTILQINLNVKYRFTYIGVNILKELDCKFEHKKIVRLPNIFLAQSLSQMIELVMSCSIIIVVYHFNNNL